MLSTIQILQMFEKWLQPNVWAFGLLLLQKKKTIKFWPFYSLIAFPNLELFLHLKPVEEAPCAFVWECELLHVQLLTTTVLFANNPYNSLENYKDLCIHFLFCTRIKQGTKTINTYLLFTSCQKDAGA